MHNVCNRQLIKHASYINGSWHTSVSKISVNNPATNELIATVSNAGIDEIALAIKAAKAAFKTMGCKIGE